MALAAVQEEHDLEGLLREAAAVQRAAAFGAQHGGRRGHRLDVGEHVLERPLR